MFSRIKSKFIKPDTRNVLFQEQFKLFNELGSKYDIRAEEKDLFPCLNDNSGTTPFDAHYFYHPAWACRVVKEINPSLHIDISSILYFSSMLSAFIPVEYYDYRPAEVKLDNATYGRADLMNLHFEDNSIESLSCMHTIEHIGLGRYGDKIDPKGDIIAVNELKRVCAINGNLLIVLPVGIPKVMFNAHRIYDPHLVVNELFEGFDLIEFSLIKDDSEFVRNADLDTAAQQNYGCGCFWFKKLR
ncbi:DUF268 domain-containing protein [Dysgonomonas sp. 520]|uniref:DUF268 domain-containing protein n=1 Tax=Dysgonomonas sp. 520 TaxID=2302931 RepID=UPI0013D3B93F|nr:DUF268 domain-containing protein [Dysgonomonas sp. 520]NDW09798.1 DUF268 domain-containing protein [Dysgonomonas sp. 520]